MAHVYLKIDVLKEFCEEAFRKFGFRRTRQQRLRTCFFSQTGTGSNPMACSVLSATIRELKIMSSR